MTMKDIIAVGCILYALGVALFVMGVPMYFSGLAFGFGMGLNAGALCIRASPPREGGNT